MPNLNERPVCHRAEDLVTYLYDDASMSEARDFAEHLERCDSCRAEFASFRQVHESILLWRNEAFGSIASMNSSVGRLPPLTNAAVESGQFMQRKLPALAALREFFNISPLWLRGATAFSMLLLLCLLAALAASRLWKQPAQPQMAANREEEKVFSQTEFLAAVKSEVEKRVTELQNAQLKTANKESNNQSPRATGGQRQNSTRPQLARLPQTRLTRQEREQLAADLRLIPGKEDELPFVLSDEPDQ